MSVRVTESTMVYPAEATPKQSLWLSKLDMMIRQPYSHTNLLYIYRPNNNTNSSTLFFDVENLKGALRKALVLYYPVAGRLKMNDNDNRFEIDCNEKGVLFIEAETNSTLSDNVSDEFRKELIAKSDYSKGLSSFPLFIAQITRFSCGGVTLCMATHHHVADGVSHMQFINCWANLARGVKPEVIPCHDRFGFLGAQVPPQVNFKHLEYEPPLPPLPPKSLSGETLAVATTEYLRLSEEQIKTLKCASISTISNKISTFKVIAAHVWRSTCKARGLADDQDVKLYLHTDGRSRLKDPSLPQGYFGNVLYFACCVAKAGELIHNPLFYTISKIDEAIKKMGNSEYLRSAVDYLELQSDLTALIRGAHYVTCPNLQINNWGRLNFFGADFGWGKPDSIGHGEIKCEGQSKIISNLSKDNSTYVGIRLFAPHMELFRKCFYDFPKMIKTNSCKL
ncbi:anthranilate N-benzoyltransferase protein 2-like [Silene latifolia]|uniref:anthranilate N-benzoyltransferase protein 2-like n=1 Tax=Silene latifolia TaxID=37657 RepID=UPI003D786984